ncbi:MAG: gamma-glutamyltransferase [Candidatus Aminicenantes bacterium]|nr:gamma-glutamyltransferase [Candidatus Aminicenantes bacterium]
MRIRSLFIPLLLGFFVLSFCQKNQDKGASNTSIEPAIGTNGMVSSAHPFATNAGLDILKAGGNAFDAAVTVAALLNVVEPAMSGMGGYGTIMIYDADKKEARFLNSSSRIPQSVDSDVFRAPTPHYLANRRGAKAVSTPGNVHAWEAMSQEYGNLKWEKLFAPAIRMAEEGFVVNKGLASLLQRAFPSFPAHAKRIYGTNGNPLQKGDRLVQRDLGHSFRLLSKSGASVFYQGEIGQAIDKAMKNADGFLSLHDLQSDKAEWWTPISIPYRGYEVLTASPPSTAFPSLIRLGMMSQFDNQDLCHNSVEYLHRFAEVTKLAFWCRLSYAGDPDFKPPPLRRLLSEHFWKEEIRKIDPKTAKPFQYPGIIEKKGSHTTHFVVADQDGNIVCATQTLGNSFGSRIMPKGTGIWLNNSLAYCTFEPKGNPMDAHAGHHKLSGDCPTLIMKQGRPWAALGTPGGHTIGQTVPQIVMNLIDFKMNIQQAISAPRISFVEPNILLMETDIPKDIQMALKQMGHRIREGRGIGNAHGLTIQYNAKGLPIRFTGSSDPRGQGLAKGF